MIEIRSHVQVAQEHVLLYRWTRVLVHLCLSSLLLFLLLLLWLVQYALTKLVCAVHKDGHFALGDKEHLV